MSEPSLYDRLGGVFAIAAVVNHFSDAVVQNPVVGKESKNPELRDRHNNQLDLDGLGLRRARREAPPPLRAVSSAGGRSPDGDR